MTVSILSINMNKRMANTKWSGRFRAWIESFSVDLILLQEPWPHILKEPVLIDGFCLIGGNSNAASYRSGKALTDATEFSLVSERWSALEAGPLKIHNVYFPCRSGKAGAIERAEFLADISSSIQKRDGMMHFVFGDFNLSPRTIDGLYGGEISSWTTEREREALRQLEKVNSLVDLGETEASPVFTYEKVTKGKAVQFRCDLALAPRDLVDKGKISYSVLHDARLGDNAFTDHSATLVRIEL